MLTSCEYGKPMNPSCPQEDKSTQPEFSRFHRLDLLLLQLHVGRCVGSVTIGRTPRSIAIIVCDEVALRHALWHEYFRLVQSLKPEQQLSFETIQQRAYQDEFCWSEFGARFTAVLNLGQTKSKLHNLSSLCCNLSPTGASWFSTPLTSPRSKLPL